MSERRRFKREKQTKKGTKKERKGKSQKEDGIK